MYIYVYFFESEMFIQSKIKVSIYFSCPDSGNLKSLNSALAPLGSLSLVVFVGSGFVSNFGTFGFGSVDFVGSGDVFIFSSMVATNSRSASVIGRKWTLFENF